MYNLITLMPDSADTPRGHNYPESSVFALKLADGPLPRETIQCNDAAKAARYFGALAVEAQKLADAAMKAVAEGSKHLGEGDAV